MGPEPPPESEQLPEWLSTAAGGAEAGAQLRRTSEPAAQCLPETLQLGGGWPDVVTFGRHVSNTAVLQLKAVSNVHCQIALRPFTLADKEEVHEALFLRDLSKHRTLVNGVPAKQEWHWLQEGDAIGVRPDWTNPGDVLNVFEVHYCELRSLPGSALMVEADVPRRALQEARDEHVGRGRNSRAKLEPAEPAAAAPKPGPPAARGAAARGAEAKGADADAADTGRGGKRKRPAGGKAAAKQPKVKQIQLFGDEVCGRVIDLTYIDPPATYRVKITSFDKEQGWHNCDSEGLSTWDGESFTDLIDLNQMNADGLVKFLDSWSPAKPPAPKGGKKKKR